MVVMKFKAIIFDLFGTLVPSFSESEYREKVKQIAAILGAPPTKFWQLWSETFYESVTGVIPGLEAKIITICNRLGMNIERSKLKEATDMLFNYTAQNMLPRPEAEEVLSELKSRGHKIGLITDCGGETPILWMETSLAKFFDITVFSCSAGMKKPDPRIYQLATKELGVEANDCLYVGDGSSMELTGASRVGMQVVQLRAPGEDHPDVYRVDKEDWKGDVITSLNELLTFRYDIAAN
jgi:putative hydrolase of the HAD superfamily